MTTQQQYKQYMLAATISAPQSPLGRLRSELGPRLCSRFLGAPVVDGRRRLRVGGVNIEYNHKYFNGNLLAPGSVLGGYWVTWGLPGAQTGYQP